MPDLDFDWYGTPETATLLAIRNARHHNLAQRIRGLYTYHLQQTRPELPRTYVFVDYPETEDGGDTFDVPVSWYDLATMLALPSSENRLRSSATKSISEYLAADKLSAYAAVYNLPPESVFFNVPPLIVNAGRKIASTIRKHVAPRSLEGRYFLDHFQTVLPANTREHVVSHFDVFLSP